MEEKLDEINMSNLELFKDQSKTYRKALNAIFFTCLRELPKELLIEGLKKKKIIKQDWHKKGKQYSEYKDDELTLARSKRTTEPVKIKLKRKDNSEVFIDATKITTKPVNIEFNKDSEYADTASCEVKDD